MSMLLLAGCKKESASEPIIDIPTVDIPVPMVLVTGGTFQMGSTTGSPDETPVHLVTVGTFYIDKTEVTYEKWTSVYDWGLTHGYTDLPAGQNGTNSVGVNNPVTKVSWIDILKWCNARSEKDGWTPLYYTDDTLTTVYRTGQLDLTVGAVKWTANGYRLPTEGEWEFAAQGGTKSAGYTHSGSNNIDSVAWHFLNTTGTHPVATKATNELGLYDMSGNVWEWCWDWYGAYSASAQTDPRGATSGAWRVLRGGSFVSVGSSCRVASRISYYPSNRLNHNGFRCVRDVE